MKQGCGILILNENNEVLICKRSEKDGFKKWCFVGGLINNGESPTQAIIREVKEEVGLDIIGLQLINTLRLNNSIEYIFISYNYYGDIKLQLDEISEYKWVSFEDIYKYDLFWCSELSLEIFCLYNRFKFE